MTSSRLLYTKVIDFVINLRKSNRTTTKTQHFEMIFCTTTLRRPQIDIVFRVLMLVLPYKKTYKSKRAHLFREGSFSFYMDTDN